MQGQNPGGGAATPLKRAHVVAVSLRELFDRKPSEHPAWPNRNVHAQFPRSEVWAEGALGLGGLFLDGPGGQLVADQPFVMAAVPAFNEAKTIGAVVSGSRRHVDEVVVVDDGSTDQTASMASQAGARVVRHPQNLGYGAALKTCLASARENGTDVLVILDGDGQHRPDEIPRLVSPVVQGQADVCIGSRFLLPHSRAKIPAYRRMGIRVLTRLTNLGTHHNGHLQDAQSGFRAYSREAIDSINPQERGMGASAEILWDADKRGLRILEVPVTIDYDTRRFSRGAVSHGLSVIGSMLRYVRADHPLLFFGISGLILLVAGVVMGPLGLRAVQLVSSPSAAFAFITVPLLLAGLLLGSTGLILRAGSNAKRREK